ncbi:Basic-leucine zipper (bZIP) transcription factor family protein [Striga hermonthica]|uniref:Basic-leucine zipper (BZIP) transcription factor family protein n=1 Tax=Striga hermonthica TaxID=68872 RepID=A0A9N7NSA5_STRHE|nr:Basic-leucine zipper (bZIP) transcription factor family protein [Striga hermonthica]
MEGRKNFIELNLVPDEGLGRARDQLDDASGRRRVGYPHRRRRRICGPEGGGRRVARRPKRRVGIRGGYAYETISGVVGMNEGVEVEGFGRREGERSRSLSGPLDKAEQWRRARESAARSRERKQAYQVELESILLGVSSGLGVEITRRKGAVSDTKEQTKKRLKQLMEKRKPPRMRKDYVAVELHLGFEVLASSKFSPAQAQLVELKS